MKNQLLIINTHSFVDLITNSSTELYVCDASKTVEAIRAILVKLLATHNELMGTSLTFEEVFQEPEITEYHFDDNLAPKELQQRLYKHDVEYRHPPDPENRLVDRMEDLELAIPRVPYGLASSDPVEYQRLDELRDIAVSDLWTDFATQRATALIDMFLVFLEQNNVADSIMDRVKAIASDVAKAAGEKANRRYVFIRFEDDDIYRLFNEFDSVLSRNEVREPGAVLIYSKSDNSIPYELMDSIASYLNASRHHLG